DLKTFQELDVYGMAIVTALVARHPETGVNVHKQTLEAIEAQFSTALNQVKKFDGMKTGMLFSKEIIEKVTEMINFYQIDSVVVDSVLVGKSRPKLLKDDAIIASKEKLIPSATMITPNMTEAAVILDHRKLNTVHELKSAAIDLHIFVASYVLVTGGELEGPAI